MQDGTQLILLHISGFSEFRQPGSKRAHFYHPTLYKIRIII